MRAWLNHSEGRVCGAEIHPGAQCHRLLAAVHAVVGLRGSRGGVHETTTQAAGPLDVERPKKRQMMVVESVNA